MIPAKKIDFWINNRLNVLLEGSHGIGKTAIIEEAFNKHFTNWRYFSAATMDPWVDFIGVPKEIKRSDGTSVLELIKPAEFQDDTVEAVFFDEFNRASPKVRNAVMELIQFKSINGRRFDNLQLIWAAVNPYDENETYDVEQLDPAQQDRFHIYYKIPTKPSKEFFIEKYGQTLGERAVEWWNLLPETSQPLVSPRRLDYAVDYFKIGGDLKDILPKEVRPAALKRILSRVEDAGEISHRERWLTSGELYAEEMKSSRSSIDVVDAFKELIDISYDQAVAYVSRLSPKQLEKIAGDSTTAALLIQQARFGSQVNADSSVPLSSRRIISALEAHMIEKSVKDKMFSEALTEIESKNTGLFTAVRDVGVFRNSTPKWTTLNTIATRQLDAKALSYHECYVLATAILDRFQGIKRVKSGFGTMNAELLIRIMEYVHTYYHNRYSELVCLDPKTLVNTLEYHG